MLSSNLSIDKYSEILKVLDISIDEVLSVNNFSCNLDEIYINDFVPFKDLKVNSLSFLNNTNYDFHSISSGLCIIEKKTLNFYIKI